MSVCFPLLRSGNLNVCPATCTSWYILDHLIYAVFNGSVRKWTSSKDKSWKMPIMSFSSDTLYSQSLGSLSDRIQVKGAAGRGETFLAEEGKKSSWKNIMPVPFPEQKIAVLRKLYSAVRNGGGENFQREKKIPTLRKSIKNLKAVAFLSLNSGFKWMFSNTINHCSSVQSFICKYAFSNFVVFFSPITV